MGKSKLRNIVKEAVREILLKEYPDDFGFGEPESPKAWKKDKLQGGMLDSVQPFLIGYYRDQGFDQRAAAGKAQDKFLEIEELVIDAMMKISL